MVVCVYDYFYGPQSDQFNFIRIPAVLFSKEEFKGLSSEAKILYGILLKRMDLSAKNGWFDEQGRVFIICTLEEIMETMNCADNKATKLMNELEEKCGLIERKRQGQGKPNLIYVKNFISSVDNLGGQPPESRFKTRENHDSGVVKTTNQKSLIVIVDGDALTECLMHGPAQRGVQMGFPAEDEREAVHGIVTIVQDHLQVVQDPGGKVLGFVDSKEQGLPFFVIEIPDLVLYGTEHSWLSALAADAEDRAELLVKFSNADCGKADIFHVVKVWIEGLREAAQGVCLPHARAGGEQPDPPGILQIIQAGSHLVKVP